MDAGYLSKQAVSDLIAVKQGEIDYLRRLVQDYELKNQSLLDQIAKSR